MRLLASAVLAVVLTACGGPAEEEKPDAGPIDPGGGARALALTATPDKTEAPILSEVRVTAAVSVAGGLATDLSGQVVNFVVTKGGGKVFAGSAKTNTAGEAREVWTLGTTAGDQELEVRAVDQTTGDPIVYARVTTKALPGSAVSWSISPQRVDVQAGEAWDYSAVRIYGADAYGNGVQVEQGVSLRGISFQGGYQGMDAPPTCTVEGTLIRCPKPSGFTTGCSPCSWGTYRAVFDTPYNMAMGANETQIVVN